MPFLKVRQHLAQSEGFILQSLLAAGLGLAVALVVLAFHGLIDLLIMAAGEPGSWEVWQVLALPTLGAVFVFAILNRYPKRASFGLRHVVNELHHAPWHWPTTNAFLQFFLTPIVLASGQSGGREGPAVHLGATLGAMTTERFHLPRNNLRVMVGAGTAAAIGGSFLTPLAGVAFAMEVVVLEYTVAGFLPIIVSAVVASTMVSWISGQPLVPFPNFDSMGEPALVWVALIGIFAGCTSALFNATTRWAERHRPPYSILLAGIACALVGLVFQDALGDGQGLWRDLTGGQITLGLLAGWLVSKLFMTAVVAGWGMPLGLITPLLLLGAITGSLVSMLGTGQWLPVYALIGMACTMGAALMAPLAALVFIIELSDSTLLIAPAMLALAIAVIIHRSLGQGGLVLDQLKDAGQAVKLHQSNHPLDHLGLDAALQTRLVRVSRRFAGLPRNADWVIWRQGPRTIQALAWLDFVRQTDDLDAGALLNTLDAPTLGRANADATLAEVLGLCRKHDWQGVYVIEDRQIRGIVLEEQLRAHFQ